MGKETFETISKKGGRGKKKLAGTSSNRKRGAEPSADHFLLSWSKAKRRGGGGTEVERRRRAATQKTSIKREPAAHHPKEEPLRIIKKKQKPKPLILVKNERGWGKTGGGLKGPGKESARLEPEVSLSRKDEDKIDDLRRQDNRTASKHGELRQSDEGKNPQKKHNKHKTKNPPNPKTKHPPKKPTHPHQKTKNQPHPHFSR